MLYLLNLSYCPNTAFNNRMLAYYKAIETFGIETTVVYFLPNSHYDKIPITYKYIRVIYMWKNFIYYRSFIKKIFLRLYIKLFMKKLRNGDMVYTYGINSITDSATRVKGVRVFAEITEHPLASIGTANLIIPKTVKDIIKIAKKLTGLFVISTHLKDYFVENGLESSKLSIINIIVDPNRFNGIAKQINNEKYIAYCGTASNNKDGVDQLIRSFYYVVKSHPNIKLYIIGSTPSKKQEFDNLQLVNDLGLDKNVVFTGIVQSSSIPQILMNAIILALDRPCNLQSKYGFPTKLGEYLQTGNPVVLTSVGDIPLFLKDGESALIAEPNNPKAFANKLIWAIEHPVEASIIGQNGKKIAIENFNYLIETKKLIDTIIY